MEFIKNHFYKLTKEIPVKQLFQIPRWRNGGTYYDYYDTYTISTYHNGTRHTINSNTSSYEASKRFTLGGIYQAVSNTALYDYMGHMWSLDGNEIECFEEVEIGLNEISKRFMEKHINSGKMAINFNFLVNNNLVTLKMALNGKHFTWVSVIGAMGQVNEMLHNAYIMLRKAYIEKFKTYLEVNYRWSTIMGGYRYYNHDIETNGVLVRL